MSTWQKYAEFVTSRGNIEHCIVISSDDGAEWGLSTPDFYLREYKTMIMQEDGTEKEETVNEAANVLKYMKGQTSSQGLRLNGERKHQITRNYVDEETGLQVTITKIPFGGACFANAGRCILIGTFNEKLQHTSPECNETIIKLAGYLKKSVWPEGLFEGDAVGGGGDAVGGGGGGGEGSWTDHVQKVLVGSKNIAEAMIVRVETLEVLAAHPAGFALQSYEADIPQEDGTDRRETVDEAKNLKTLLTQKVKPSQGFRLSQTKYQVIRQFEDEVSTCYTVYGKKAMGGCVAVLAGPVIVVASFDEKQGHAGPGCNEAVAQLSKYFKEQLR
jgi:hypothetical protein